MAQISYSELQAIRSAIATKIDITNAVPTGTVIMYCSMTPPNNYLVCDGSSVSRATYAELFGVIGTGFGSVDGDHFNLPDLRSQFVVGASATAPGGGLTQYALNTKGGAESVAITADQMPSHAHPVSITDNGHSHTASTSVENHSHPFSDNTLNTSNRPTAYSAIPVDTGDMGIGATSVGNNTGSVAPTASTLLTQDPTGIQVAVGASGNNQAHENRPPFTALAYMIKYQ